MLKLTDREYTLQMLLLVLIMGRFRWLDCQLQILKTCATPLAVKKVLNDLPKSLEVYYTRILEAIDESNQQPVQNLLRWIAFAFRPVCTQHDYALLLLINCDRSLLTMLPMQSQ